MGVMQLAEAITKSLQERLPAQRKTQREALGTLIATMLDVRSPNTVDLASGLPRAAERLDMRLQWVSRVLSNRHIDAGEVMAPFARELLTQETGANKTLVLSIDQSQISERFQMLMISLRHGERAVPLGWSVKETQGGMGFAAQEPLLEQVLAVLPDDAQVVLMGDRFYGTPDLIEWCRSNRWGWRLRLKDNLTLRFEGKETKLAELATREQRFLTNVRITHKAVRTHIGIVQDKGHKEPWIIAMSEPPDYFKTMDYGMRWGIECMFSDLKSRGFSLEETQLRYADRVERLVLVMALALYFAVSCGLWDRRQKPMPFEKNTRKKRSAA
jgi:hypothetical protein